MKFFFIIFLLPLKLFAQDITGVWTGTLYNDTTQKYIPYELAISEYSGKLSGYSYTIFIIDGIKNIGVKAVKIKKKNEAYFVEDEKLIDNNYTEPPAKGVRTFSTLIFSENDSTEILSGSWKTNRTKEYNSLTGTIFLEKKKKIRESLIVPKLDQLGLTNKLSFIPATVKNDPGNEKAFTINEKQATTEKTIAIAGGKNKDKVKDETIKETTNTGTLNNQQKEPETTNRVNPTVVINDETIITEEKVVSGQTESLKKEAALNAQKVIIEETNLQKPEKNIAVTAKKNKSPQEKKSNQNILAGNAPKEIDQKEILAKPPAAEILNRKIETIQTVEVIQDSLVFSLFDNGIIDGDTVSVLINGKVIWPKVGLLAKASNKTIYLTPEMGDSIYVVMYAENLGSIPPNTGLLVVRDGAIDHEIRFSGDLKKNSAIILKRKKKD